jgi:hypothetical protein
MERARRPADRVPPQFMVSCLFFGHGPWTSVPSLKSRNLLPWPLPFAAVVVQVVVLLVVVLPIVVPLIVVFRFLSVLEGTNLPFLILYMEPRL